MRHLLVFVVFLCTTPLILAQNWAPFQLENTYNYQNLSNSSPLIFINENCTGAYSGAPVYPSVILGMYSLVDLQVWVDSVATNNTDTIYYFNKKIVACDTCSEPAIIINQSLDYGLVDSFYIKNNQGQYVFFYKGDSLIINHSMGLNDSMMSDYTNYLYSKVVQVDPNATISFLNTTDSIKVLHYYNAANILLYKVGISKNHGIYSFEDVNSSINQITLLGIEARDEGVLQLNWKRAFDFQVGDVLCFIDLHRHNLNYRYNVSKVNFLNRQDVGNDTIIYSVIISRNWGGYSFPYSTGTNVDTVNLVLTKNFIRSTNFYTQLYYSYFQNISRVNQRDNELNLSYYQGLTLQGKGLLSKDFLINVDGRQYKYLSYALDLEGSFPGIWNIEAPNFNVDTTSDVYYFDYYYGPESLKEIYGEGLGLVYRYEYQFEGFNCHSLFGYIKGVDTVGLILSDQIFLNNQLVSIGSKPISFNLYPNPTNDYVNIEINQLAKTERINFIIRDISGKVVRNFSEPVRMNYQLEIKNLSSGIYFLELKNDKRILLGFEKIVVN